MNGSTFSELAAASVEDIVFDPAVTMRGVYRRRRRRHTVLAARIGCVAIAVAGAFAIPILDNGHARHEQVQLEPYVITAAEAPTLATIAGVDLTYLPEGAASTPVSVEERPGPDDHRVLGCFIDSCRSGVGVTVTRGQGLDLDRYLKTHWVGATTDTTVGGSPALALSVKGDDAAGLIWAPESGVVVEVHVGSRLRHELRPIVEGIRVDPRN